MCRRPPLMVRVSIGFLAFFFFLMIRRPPRSTLFPYRRSSDLPDTTALAGGFRRLRHLPGLDHDVLEIGLDVLLDPLQDKAVAFGFRDGSIDILGPFGLALADAGRSRAELIDLTHQLNVRVLLGD